MSEDNRVNVPLGTSGADLAERREREAQTIALDAKRKEEAAVAAHADLRTRFALEIAGPVIAGIRARNALLGAGTSAFATPNQIVAAVYDLADYLAEEDAERRKMDGAE